MGTLFNEEKILYFANQKKGLHVSVYEDDTTDLSMLVEDALASGLLYRVAADDSGLYYKTTTAGEIRLLELQIKWRRQRGKPVSQHTERLEQLKTEAA